MQTFQSVLALKQEMDILMVTFGKKAHNASKLLEFLYQNPITMINDVSEALEISRPTANKLIKEFEVKGIVEEITGYQRNKLFIFKRYLDIYSQS